MATESVGAPDPWPIADAKARLSHILRCAEQDGPQRIGRHRTFVIVPEQLWEERSSSGVSLGRWLVEHMPRGYELEIAGRDSLREIPFADSGPDAA